jgi:hypothetical protein
MYDAPVSCLHFRLVRKTHFSQRNSTYPVGFFCAKSIASHNAVGIEIGRPISHPRAHVETFNAAAVLGAVGNDKQTNRPAALDALD